MMIKSMILAAAVVLLACTAQAVPITGTVAMQGTVTIDNADLALATQALSFTNVTVSNGTGGSYPATDVGATVTVSPFSWASPSLPMTVWSYVAGGRTKTFSLSSMSIVSQTSTALTVTGVGSLTVTGTGPAYDPTTGSFPFTIAVVTQTPFRFYLRKAQVNGGSGNFGNFFSFRPKTTSLQVNLTN